MAFGNATKGDLKKISGGGGSGGTTNYNDLSNKPSINGVTLSGNKTSSDLQISGSITIDDITTDILDSTKKVDVTEYKAFWFLYQDTANPVQTISSGMYVMSAMTDGMRLLCSTTNNYCVYDVHVASGEIYLTKSPDGTPMDIYKVYGIK